MARAQILIIEDEPKLQQQLCRLLEKMGHQAQCAVNAIAVSLEKGLVYECTG